MEIITKTAEETASLGERIGTALKRGERNGAQALLFLLRGELGSGKTTFMQGLGRGLGITTRLLSPTFTFIREYALSGKFSRLYHLDLYRLDKHDDVRALGLDELLSDSSHIICIEWPEKGNEIIKGNPVIFDFVTLSDGTHKIVITDTHKQLAL